MSMQTDLMVDTLADSLYRSYGAQCITVKQLAKESGHHYETIRRWCEDGTITTRPRRRPKESWKIPIMSAAVFIIEGRK